jgi:4a-hydroxytetrahydrobiopterin dehydratase
MKVLSQDEIKARVGGLKNWTLTPAGIQRRFELGSFTSVMRLVNKVAAAAEKANHHPDIYINYDKVTFTLITHDAGGITQRDFNLAAQIDGLAR